MRSTIICIDDDRFILSALSDQLSEWLKDNYTIEKALSGQEAFEIMDECKKEGVDVSLVISDYVMPGMKGDAVLEQVKQISPETRRIMLTGYAAIEGITNAINRAGIYRYISKPWDPKDLMLTVFQAIRSYEQDKRTEQLNDRNKVLCGTLKKMSDSLQVSLKNVVAAFSTAIDLRLGELPGHTKRVAAHAVKFAGVLKMPEDALKNLETAALLHDVGVLGMNDSDLASLKLMDCFTDNAAARKKTEMAKQIIEQADLPWVPGILYHAEHADGTGAYGMTDVPADAKIIALCDYYDLYKHTGKGDHKAIITAMSTLRGTVFDTELFDKFASCEAK